MKLFTTGLAVLLLAAGAYAASDNLSPSDGRPSDLSQQSWTSQLSLQDQHVPLQIVTGAALQDYLELVEDATEDGSAAVILESAQDGELLARHRRCRSRHHRRYRCCC